MTTDNDDFDLDELFEINQHDQTAPAQVDDDDDDRNVVDFLGLTDFPAEVRNLDQLLSIAAVSAAQPTHAAAIKTLVSVVDELTGGALHPRLAIATAAEQLERIQAVGRLMIDYDDALAQSPEADPVARQNVGWLRTVMEAAMDEAAIAFVAVQTEVEEKSEP